MTEEPGVAGQQPEPVAPAGPVPPPSDADQASSRPGREPGELIVAMSPRQIIGGFALLAGLILMLRRRSRRSRRSRGQRGSSGEG